MLLDMFTLVFATEGLGEVAKDISETERKIDSLEKEEAKLNETIKKGGEEAEKARKRIEEINKELPKAREHLQAVKGSTAGVVLQLRQVATVAAKIAGTFKLVQKATGYTDDFAGNVLEVAEAAKTAKKSLEEYQKQTFGRVIFSKDDVNAAKEYEMTLRDIRAGTAQIGANLAQLLLPAMTAVAKITSKIIDFFVDHGEFIKAVIVGIGIAIAAYLIPQVAALTAEVWALLFPILAPILAVTAAIVGLALVFEDLWKWMHGEPSVAELLFGDFENVKNNVLAFWENLKTAFIDGFNTIKNFLTPIFETIWEYMQSYFRLWGAIFSFIAAKLMPIFQAIGEFIGNIVSAIGENLMPVLNTVGSFFKWLFDIIKSIAEFIGSNLLSGLQGLFKMGGTLLKVGTALNNAVADKIDGSHANGLDRVPFNGYHAILHEDEAVLNKDEANDWRSGLMAAKRAVNFTASYPLNAIPSGAVSNAYNSSSSNKTINIGDITIQTQATDAQGIATDIASYIKQAVISLDDGMLA